MHYHVRCYVCYEKLEVLDDPRKREESDPDRVIAKHVAKYHQ